MGNCISENIVSPNNKIDEKELIRDLDAIFTTFHDNIHRENAIKIKSFSKQKYRKKKINGFIVTIKETE